MRSTKPSSAEIHVQFETAPELVSGIELTTNGQKVAWSIADYLASLEKSVGELLDDDGTEPSPNPKTEPNGPSRTSTEPKPRSSPKQSLHPRQS